jgi:SAM-dependent methyltransferase
MHNPTLDVYREYVPAGKEAGLLPLVENARVLEIGFGGAKLLEALRDRGNEVYGVDASQNLVEQARAKGFEHVHMVDISDAPMPFEDDLFDAVYAYEVFEHLTNPHRMFAEVRRVLRKDGLLFFSVPAQEIDMGYGVNRHTFVYPGLLEKSNLERFIMQMYFRIEYQFEPGPRQHLVGRNYILRNMKPADKADVVEVIIGNYNVRELYGFLLSEEQLAREIEIEVKPYLLQIQQLAEGPENRRVARGRSPSSCVGKDPNPSDARHPRRTRRLTPIRITRAISLLNDKGGSSAAPHHLHHLQNVTSANAAGSTRRGDPVPHIISHPRTAPGPRLFSHCDGNLLGSLWRRTLFAKQCASALGATALRAVLHADVPPPTGLTASLVCLHGAALHCRTATHANYEA